MNYRPVTFNTILWEVCVRTSFTRRQLTYPKNKNIAAADDLMPLTCQRLSSKTGQFMSNKTMFSKEVQTKNNENVKKNCSAETVSQNAMND